MAERRWVLDAHTLVSRLLTPNGSAARAVDHALNIGVPLVSDATLAELAAALARPRLDRWVVRIQPPREASPSAGHGGAAYALARQPEGTSAGSRLGGGVLSIQAMTAPCR